MSNTYWMIEKRIDGAAHWWIPDHSQATHWDDPCRWTTDSSEAKHYDCRSYAEYVMGADMIECIATERPLEKRVGVGTCGHFCEACARRDDEIKRLRNLVKNFADVVEAKAFAMKAPNLHTPIFVQLANTARQSVMPNAVLSGVATETTTECGASPRPPAIR